MTFSMLSIAFSAYQRAYLSTASASTSDDASILSFFGAFSRVGPPSWFRSCIDICTRIVWVFHDWEWRWPTRGFRCTKRIRSRCLDQKVTSVIDHSAVTSLYFKKWRKQRKLFNHHNFSEVKVNSASVRTSTTKRIASIMFESEPH